MELLINKTKDFSPKLLKEVAENSPWEGLKKQLLVEVPTDKWVQAVKENLSSLLLLDSKLVSYGAFGNKGDLFEGIISACGFDLTKTFVGIYLFTVSKYRDKGNARKLKLYQIKYIKEVYPRIKYLVGSTSSEQLLEKYLSWGAKQISNITRNKLIETEMLENDYFYYYEI